MGSTRVLVNKGKSKRERERERVVEIMLVETGEWGPHYYNGISVNGDGISCK